MPQILQGGDHQCHRFCKGEMASALDSVRGKGPVPQIL